MLALLSSSKGVIQAQLAWIATVLKPLYDLNTSLQRDSGGILDVLGEVNRYPFKPAIVNTFNPHHQNEESF